MGDTLAPIMEITDDTKQTALLAIRMALCDVEKAYALEQAVDYKSERQSGLQRLDTALRAAIDELDR